jgi:hypothetical protein
VLFYGAWEAVIGLATGGLVEHANDVPAGKRSVLSDTLQSLQDNVIVGDPGVVGSVGALAWITAVIAAAVAYRGVGAPILVSILLGLSLDRGFAPPPIGPIGLLCFATAVALLARSARVPSAVDAPPHARAPEPLPTPALGSKA